MPRFTIEHPYDADLRVEYGYDPDPRIGYFVDCFAGNEILVVYDASQPGYDRENPLAGAMQFLVQFAFFAEYELEAALDALASPEPVEVSARVRRVMTVIENLKRRESECHADTESVPPAPTTTAGAAHTVAVTYQHVEADAETQTRVRRDVVRVLAAIIRRASVRTSAGDGGDANLKEAAARRTLRKNRQKRPPKGTSGAVDRDRHRSRADDSDVVSTGCTNPAEFARLRQKP